MALASSPWRALRPALLAGAAAVTWLTLSSTAASADSGPDSTSLPGNVGSSVSSLTHDLADAVPPAPANSSAVSGATPGLLQPVAAQVSGVADNLIAAVPAVNQVVPAGTVSSVSVPIGGAADGVAAGLVQVVAAPAVEAVPVLEPVLQPVSDVLAGSTPLTLPLPDSAMDAVQVELPAALAPVPAEAQPAALGTTPNAVETATELDQAEDALPMATAGSNADLARTGAGVAAGTAALRPATSALTDPVSEQPLSGGPEPLAAQSPAPASGAGSGGSSGSPSGTAAWLSPYDFGFERPGTVLAGDAPDHAPGPVSFDPGSSPD